ncbi:MAG TPA: TasA family protein, partial [Candidatus Limnocylindrales bacterium]
MDQVIVDSEIRRRRARRRGIVALLGAVSLLTIGASSMSLAQFTDSATSTWAFTTGTIDISTSPAVLTAIGAMMPGDNKTQALTVTNAGSGDLRYALSVAATNALGTA